MRVRHGTLALLTVIAAAPSAPSQARLAVPWPPPRASLPAVWFGGPLQGESNQTLQSLARRYSMVFLSSQGRLSERACRTLKASAAAGGRSIICMTYRQTACAWGNAPPFRAAISAAAHDGWWLKNNNGTNWLGPRGHMWDWRVPAVQDWYAGAATEALLAMHPSVDGAFFDDFDGAVCPFESAFSSLPSHYGATERAAMHRAKMAVFGRVAAIMQRGGQYPVFAMSAVFNSSTVPAKYRCNVGEAQSLAQLGPAAGFFRYHIWPYHKAVTPTRCHAQMAEMELEGQQGVELFFYTIVERGEALSDVAVAAFLLRRRQHSVFGASAGWTDPDWAWHRQYDVDYGAPQGPAYRVGGLYRRDYTRSVVELDCSRLRANITLI